MLIVSITYGYDIGQKYRKNECDIGEIAHNGGTLPAGLDTAGKMASVHECILRKLHGSADEYGGKGECEGDICEEEAVTKEVWTFELCGKFREALEAQRGDSAVCYTHQQCTLDPCLFSVNSIGVFIRPP